MADGTKNAESGSKQEAKAPKKKEILDHHDWVPEYEYVCPNSEKCNYREYNFNDPGERQCPNCKEANLEKRENKRFEVMKRIAEERLAKWPQPGRRVWSS